VAKVRFDWEDALGLDSQLTGERMIRDAARTLPRIACNRVIAAFADETTDPEIFAEMGAQGLLGVTSAGTLWRGGCLLCRLWPGGARGGAGRFRLSLDDERAVEPGDASDPCLWL
jgi:hypothetical protein